MQEAYLKASNINQEDEFGRAVSISNERCIVGAPTGDGGVVDSGTANVFLRTGSSWAAEYDLEASNPDPSDGFGAAVWIAGDSIIVGAPFEDSNATGVGGNQNNNTAVDSGAAYVFSRSGSTWTQDAYLKASNTSAAALFGEGVALTGDMALVGAEAGGTGGGAAYTFLRDSTTSMWSPDAFIPAPASGNFGVSVSASDYWAVVGAFMQGAGAAYVYDLAASVQYCTAGTSASGCQAIISSQGHASATALSGFSLITSNVEGQKDGLYFFGTNGRQANSWGNGTSYQCVVPPVTRTPVVSGTGTVGMCDGQTVVDLNALWCPSCLFPQKNPGVGALVQAQLWYRDPMNTSNQTTSFSDAIEFPVKP
jgi:hypothetical protein